MDDDLQRRLDDISVHELRRRVDLGLRYVRELRGAIAVAVGMAAEGAPSAVPMPDPEKAKQTFEELTEMLPLLRRRLTPEERARLRPLTPEARAAAEEIIAEVEADPEAFDAAAEENGVSFRAADVLRLREEGEKIDMLDELRQETQAFVEELQAYKARAEEQIEALAALIASRGGEG